MANAGKIAPKKKDPNSPRPINHHSLALAFNTLNNDTSGISLSHSSSYEGESNITNTSTSRTGLTNFSNLFSDISSGSSVVFDV